MLGVTGFCFLFGLIVLEVVLRFTPLGAEFHDPWLMQPTRHLALREYPPNATFQFAAPEIRRSSGDPVAERYILQTDQDGFIRPGRSHAKADLTVVFLGGSTTECLYVDPEGRFPVLVGRMLEERLGLKVNVINAARSGSNTQHMQLIMQGKVLPLRPDIVVLMENVNDIGVLSRYGSYWPDDNSFGLVGGNAHGAAAGMRLIRDGVFGYSYRVIHGAVARGIDLALALFGANAARAQGIAQDARVEDMARQYRASLVQFVVTAQAWGIRPVLMTQVVQDGQSRERAARGDNYLADASLMRRGFTAQDFDTLHGYFNQIARDVSARHGAGLIDLARFEGWTPQMLYDGLHFSGPGARRVADLAAPALAAEAGRLRDAKN